MRRTILMALAAAALAGCGGPSAQEKARAARQQRIARCAADNYRWAVQFEATLPTPGSQADVAALAASGNDLCRLAARTP